MRDQGSRESDLSWEGVFLRDLSMYLLEFRRKTRKTPNGQVNKCDWGLNQHLSSTSFQDRVFRRLVEPRIYGIIAVNCLVYFKVIVDELRYKGSLFMKRFQPLTKKSILLCLCMKRVQSLSGLIKLFPFIYSVFNDEQKLSVQYICSCNVKQMTRNELFFNMTRLRELFILGLQSQGLISSRNLI